MTGYDKSEEQFLRRFFDSIYILIGRITQTDWGKVWADLVQTIRNTDPRVKRIVIWQFVALGLLIGATIGAVMTVERIRAANAPPVTERLLAPYNMEARPVPTFDLANPEAILPGNNGEFVQQDPEAEGAEATSYLLANCLIETAAGSEDAPCQLTAAPDYIETAQYTDNNGYAVTVVAAYYEPATLNPQLAQAEAEAAAAEAEEEAEPAIGFSFARPEQPEAPAEAAPAEAAAGEDAAESEAELLDASVILQDLYRYSRRIGRIGNFAFLSDQNVDYYYSTTRDTLAFSWSHGSWVYTVVSSQFNTVDPFLEAFPY